MAAALQWNLTGGASNSDPDASLGGVSSSEEVSATALNNLFDNVSPAESTAGDVEYRAIDLVNSGDATGTVIEIWISTPTLSTDSECEIALDAGTQSVANEDTAPSAPALSFSRPLVGTKLSISDIVAAGTQRVWIKRTITAPALNYAHDTLQLTVQFA